MARLDRVRLTEGDFPFRCEVATRFTDVDVQRHLNNVAVAAIIQEGRSRFSIENGIAALLKGRSIVVASLLIEYVGEMSHPDPVEIGVGVLEIGRSSYKLGQIARQNGAFGAFAEVVLVANQGGASTPLDDAWRAKLESLRIA